MNDARHARVASNSRTWKALAAIAVACASAAGSWTAQAQTDQSVTDLRRLESAAERRSPSMRGASSALAAAEAKLSEASISPFFQFTARGVTGLAPDANGLPGFTRDSQVPTEQPWGPFVSAGVHGAVPLYTFGKLSAARDAARAGVASAALGRRRASGQLRYDVRRAYYALQLALDTQQMISEGRSKLEKATRRLQERIADGDPDVDDFDMYRMHAAVAEVSARAAEAVRLEAAAQAALRVLTGSPNVTVPDCPSAPVAIALRDLGHYLGRAAGHRPELGMLEAAVAARRAEVRAHRASYFPGLALALQASRTFTPGRTDQIDTFVPDPANFTMLGAALVAEWNLDLWGTSARVRGAESRLAETEAHSANARDGVELDIMSTYAAVEEARERLRSWGAGHEQARRWFVAAAQGYDIGVREPRDLIDALKAYFTARFSHLQAIHDHNLALAKLEQTVGEAVVPEQAWYQYCESDAPESEHPATPDATQNTHQPHASDPENQP